MTEETKPELPAGTCEWVLLQRAQIDGAVRDPGHRFVRPEDWNPGGTTVRGPGPVGSPEEFKLDPLAVKAAELPKPAPSDGPAPGENMPAEVETVKHDGAPVVADKDMIVHEPPPPPEAVHPEPLLPPALPDPAAPHAEPAKA